MNEQYIDDIDYEHMDDLPLSDHIEWSHYITEETASEDPEELNQIDWLEIAGGGVVI
jgi:hypothetical protein